MEQSSPGLIDALHSTARLYCMMENGRAAETGDFYARRAKALDPEAVERARWAVLNAFLREYGAYKTD